jgi:hypothetical protein
MQDWTFIFTASFKYSHVSCDVIHTRKWFLRTSQDAPEDNSPISTNLRQTLKRNNWKKKAERARKLRGKKKKYRHNHKHMQMCRWSCIATINAACISRIYCRFKNKPRAPILARLVRDLRALIMCASRSINCNYFQQKKASAIHFLTTVNRRDLSWLGD